MLLTYITRVQPTTNTFRRGGGGSTCTAATLTCHCRPVHRRVRALPNWCSVWGLWCHKSCNGCNSVRLSVTDRRCCPRPARTRKRLEKEIKNKPHVDWKMCRRNDVKHKNAICNCNQKFPKLRLLFCVRHWAFLSFQICLGCII